MPLPKRLRDLLEDQGDAFSAQAAGFYRDLCSDRADMRDDPGEVPVQAAFLRELILMLNWAGNSVAQSQPDWMAKSVRLLDLGEQAQLCLEAGISQARSRREKSEILPGFEPAKEVRQSIIQGGDQHDMRKLLCECHAMLMFLMGAATAGLGREHPFLMDGLRLVNKVANKVESL